MLRRSVTTKIAIGLPPKDKSDHPQRLDHFIFQRKGQRGSGMSAEVLWEIDQEKTEHYGRGCREVEIILLDNVPDRVFRTEYAWWTATQKECWGDGETATRRTPHNPRGENWEPCANDDCLDLLEERCRPSGDLYFLEAVGRQLAGHEIEIDDPEEEQASALKVEFYPAAEIKPAPSPAASSKSSKDNQDQGQRTLLALKERIESAFFELKLNTAQRVGLLDQYQNDLPALLERLTRAIEKRDTTQTGPTDASSSAAPAKANPNGRSHAGENAVVARTEHSRRER
jgi:hypothetical protein